VISASNLVYPPTVTADADRYRYLYAALEQLRLKHNERAGDLSCEANYFRGEWKKPHAAIIHEILRLRPLVKTPDFVETLEAKNDPKLITLKSEGKAACKSADYKTLTGVDLDKATGTLELSDPLEDFTGYTEDDTPGRATVTANKIEIRDIDRDEQVLVYADKGVAHFGETWLHYVKETLINNTGVGSQICMFWAVSNVIEGVQDWGTNNREAIGLWIESNTRYFRLQDYKTGSSDNSAGVYLPSAGTPVYPAIERTSETAVESRLYSDAARTVLEDTLAVSTTSGDRHRYVFGYVSHDQAGQTGRETDIDIENLDLNEGGAAAVGPFAGAYPLKGAFDPPWR